MSLLIKGVTAHTGLTDKEVAGVIDHADGSVSDGKIASGVGLTDGQLLKLPAAAQYELLKRGAAGWFAEAGKFVELSDAPSSYSGQAGKLLKVKPDESGLLLDLLLSFADWYSGGTPTDFPWVFEADNPVEWDNYLSPIFKDDIGQYIIYSGGYNQQRFYRYNYNTKQWTRLTDPPAVIFGAISDSPDGSKLCAHGINGNVLFIYDIEANAWTSSPVAPQIDTTDVQIQTTVWADNDTIWCQVRAYVGTTWTVKCFRYVLSTATWTQFPNSITPTVHNSQGMGINPAGTILYWGQCGATYHNSYRYTIATDTYSSALDIGATRYYSYAHDRNRLWFGSLNSCRHYIDLSDESLHYNVFPTNPQVTKPSNIPAGMHNAQAIISQQRVVLISWGRSSPRSFAALTRTHPSRFYYTTTSVV